MDSTSKIPNPVDLHVGARVRELRKRLPLSQSALADPIGLTFQQLQKYERGANRISASKLFEISAILKAPISYFFQDYTENVPLEDFGKSASENWSMTFSQRQKGPSSPKRFHASNRVSIAVRYSIWFAHCPKTERATQ